MESHAQQGDDMLEVHELTKRYGDVTAVDGISFVVRPGVVTGFLGPNGAGKSTTMRMVLGLDRPTSGHALVNGRDYTRSRAPLAELGALLDAKAVDRGRSARNHLLALGATIGIGSRRVDELLEVVGLADVARKPAGAFSLGMGQRLGIATALLADPAVVMLDEPVNGLDPDGILWIRTLLKELAAEGRTVFLSSHLMSEMELTAEHLIVIGRGRIIADVSMAEFIGRASANCVRVTSPDAAMLRSRLLGEGGTVTSTAPDRLEVDGLTAARIGDIAAEHGIRLHELVKVDPSLEEAFMELTRDQVEFRGSADVTRHDDRKVA
jgi:ABC-2 type transport system ATP-binding protein